MIIPVRTHGPVTQDFFLINMGFDVRLSRLIGTAKKSENKNDIYRGAKRLVDPSGMGKQYKVLGFTGSGARQPATHSDAPTSQQPQEKGTSEGIEEVWPFVEVEKRYRNQ